MTVSSPVDRTVKMLTRTQATTSLIDTDLSHVQVLALCTLLLVVDSLVSVNSVKVPYWDDHS